MKHSPYTSPSGRSGASFESPGLRRYHSLRVDRLLSRYESVRPEEIVRMRQALRSFWLPLGIATDETALIFVACEHAGDASVFFEGMDGNDIQMKSVFITLQQCLRRRSVSDPGLQRRIRSTLQEWHALREQPSDRYLAVTPLGMRLLCTSTFTTLSQDIPKTSNPLWSLQTGLPETWHADWTHLLYDLSRREILELLPPLSPSSHVR